MAGLFGVGSTIGEYDVASRLSEGGMATLLLGRRRGDPHAAPVAIKVIHEHLSEDWQFARMFVDEALSSVRIRHPNVVRVDELGEQDHMYYLVMEYVHGCSLAQLLRTMSKRGRRMRPEIAVWIAREVAAGLHAAHEMTGHDGALLGVIHRDISPQNVLLSVDGSVKLLDFGIAKARGRAERTEAGVIKGKVRYMAPEQAAGRDIDRRIDIYALGVVLWEMLTMRRYIEGKSELEVLRKVQSPTPTPPSALIDGIDPMTDAAVMRALAPEIDARPATAEALAAELALAVPDGTVGPAHVAELLRLFMADEIAAATRALPEELGAPIAEAVAETIAETLAERSDVTARRHLPGAAPPGSSAGVGTPSGSGATNAIASAPQIGGDDETRIATLTSRVEPAPKEAPRAEPAASPLARPEGERSTLHGAGAHQAHPLLASSEDDEPTVMDEGELAAMMEAHHRQAEAALAPRGEAPPPPSAPAEAPRSGALRLISRILLITVVAFALGAGLTTIWARFLR